MSMCGATRRPCKRQPMMAHRRNMLVGAGILQLLSSGCCATRNDPAGGTIMIAPGVKMPIVANGYKPFAANNQTTSALVQWFGVGGRAVDTAFECE
jgi:hypothetical protein